MNLEFFMKFALNLASVAQGQTAPNPVVGAVIVKDGEIVGFGSHLKPGEPHAEVHAINMAGSKTKDSTLFVTLEPCNHYGKTPPCTEAIIAAGIKEVVIASIDKNPLVAGSGIERLKREGIHVQTGILKEHADQLNEAFFHFMKTRKPFVTLKQAITLDGKTATKTGHSQWITGEQARQDVHNERSKHDAILVGIGTVLKDNPSLTNRNGKTNKQPIRIVLDTHLRTPSDCKIVTDGICPTWIITGSHVEDSQIARFQQRNVEIIKLTESTIQIEEVLHLLGERNITSLYVEGGQTINASFLQSKNTNQIITYIAPKLVSGSAAPSMFADLDITNINDAYPLTFKKVEKIGDDLKITSTLN
ncbi:bifunctional diaminohydroxyphosphoribosylaminopyrimidine deaminase/5-amino-6-(5-phosphoribosylamino)uracil reductase RibD [Bacillus massiliigorillae]|uniref:bifunctional diaminohydroxyphosphoribosylaminopyrimidine deaminase/5-amino-6-(5-phosphoribosylamino)uracil reductase RibD n=1 Tax=Bacillus massiliigorillae TaxID=1243664 RepID=UPI0003A3034B|nr:bifunctional diaminohydroxyphosphoribosylaminopyrimidine deaminase/5-amino-6-(5-phosphoribosylamino)uracil reductase RibD [Bacillus massiliigorillae]